jgi:hypothetical protein
MHKLTLLLFSLLAALAVACGGDDEATDQPTAAATEDTTEEPTATDGGDGGDEQTFSSSQLPISVTVTVPEGWEHPSDADQPDIFVVLEQGRGFIDFVQPTEVYNRASETSSELGEPPADYVAWFNENALVEVLSTEPATIGGLEGTRLEIKNTSYDFALYKMSDGLDYELNLSDHVYTYVLDADGTQIIVACGVQRGEDPLTTFEEKCDEVLSTVEFGT